MMEVFASIQLPYAALGLLVGLLVGMTGVGGGSLMTPLLMLLFGVHPVTAVGTDLLFAAVTKTVGTLANGLNRTIEWRVTGRLAAGSLPAAAVTLFIVSKLDLQTLTTDHFIRGLLFVVLLLTALSLVSRRQMIAVAHTPLGNVSPRGIVILTIATGAIVGVLVSLTSIGAGAFGVIALRMLYPQLPMTRIVGSDIAHAVPLTLLAGIGHWMMGSVNWHMLGSLLLGSVPGIVIGGYASLRLSERLLRGVLAATLAVVAVKTIF